MDLQTYYNFALTCQSVCTYAATDAQNPTDVFELMVVQYKQVTEVVKQEIPDGHTPLLILGHGRCIAGRSGHRCRGRVSAVAVTQICPFHQHRGWPAHHSAACGFSPLITDRQLFQKMHMAQIRNEMNALRNSNNALQSMVPHIIGIGQAEREMPGLVGQARNRILLQEAALMNQGHMEPRYREEANEFIQQLAALHSTMQAHMQQVGDALNVLRTTM